MHYTDNPEYAGDWWNHNGYEWPNDVFEEAVGVERAREAGAFDTQADYDAAYCGAMHLDSPDQWHPRSIEQAGLGALIPEAINAEHLATLQQLSPKHVVIADPGLAHSHGLLVLALQQNVDARPRRRWRSKHPIVEAILAGDVDGAVTLPELARASVTIAPTEKSRFMLTQYPQLLRGLVVEWKLLRALTGHGETVHAVYDHQFESFWQIQQTWRSAVGNLLAETLSDPLRYGISQPARAALNAELGRTNNAIAEIERFLERAAGDPPQLSR